MKQKPSVFLFMTAALLVTATLQAQIKALPSLSDSVLFKKKIKGNVQQLYRWKDSLGENYLVLTVTDDLNSSAKTSKYGEDCDGSCSDRELYAYHFLGRDSLLWKVQDFERACNYDNLVDFRPKGTQITDLDSNGMAEVWIMYSMTCTSDVSSKELKLIMYQGKKKYAVRGTSQPSPKMIDKEFGGKYNPDAAFQSLPARMKDYGRKLWLKNLYDF